MIGGEKNLEARILRAGLGAAVFGLLVSGALGTSGGWSPVLSLTNNVLGVWIIAIVLSIFFAYIFTYWFDAFLPGSAVVRGAIFGALIWVLLLVLGGVSNFFKEAVYPDPAGASLFLSLVLHLAWGSVLSLLYQSKG
ncbi:MAG: hypothetical protein Q8P13_04280 [bacterium]|nr:hypothetical protein [bacterium]